MSDQSDESDRSVQWEPTRDLPPGLEPGSETFPNARSLRGLAHPVRVRMLGMLREEGPATATTLAHQLGLNTGATSYHLRQLAAHGFVVEDAERGTARERWWRPAHELPARPERWRPNFADFRLRVTPDELEELLTQVSELIGRYRHDETAGDSAPADAAPVVVQLQAFLRPGALADHDLDAGKTPGPDQGNDT